MPRPAYLDILTTAIKAESIITDPDRLHAALPDNPLLKTGVAPACIIRPENNDELEKLLDCANKNRLNLCLVSSPGEHYHGGFAANRENVLVDLSAWNNVQWINRRNRVCLVQPGVTYDRLLPALAREGLTIPMPLAPPSGKSVLAACMDREPVTWPNRQWDIGDPVASTEFYFANGRRFRTGAAGGPGTLEKQRKSGGAQKCPTGPSQTDFHRVLQGAQGTMGIVTWITMRAEIKPTRQTPFLIAGRDLEKLIAFVYAVQRPGLGEHTFIVNRVCAAMLFNGPGEADHKSLVRELPPFICLQNIAGFELLPKSRIAYQKKDIQQKARQSGLRMEKTLGRIAAGDLLHIATSPCGHTDWRRRLLGDCLSVFFLSTLDRAPMFIGLFEKLAEKHGFGREKIGIYLQPVVQNHGCHLEFMIPYDRKNNLSAIRQLERDSVEILMRKGAFFSRPYLFAQDRVFDRNKQNRLVLQKIKHIFDANRIFNQGKWGL